ncbi:MAG: O-antigen ligase family protein [bacterium]
MKSFRPLLGLVGAFLLGVLTLTILVTKTDVTIVMALILVAFLLLALFYWPEPGTILVIFAIYTNLAVVVYKFHGVPQVLAASVSLLLCVPLTVYWFVRKEKFIIDYPWLLMLAFLAALFGSLMVAKNIPVGMEWITTFLLEGLALYLIIINVIRKVSTLRSIIWALLLSGALLGSLTLIQELTQDYRNNFAGLAQRNTEHWSGGGEGGKLFREVDKVRLANRSSGPIGDPNRYAQIMIVLLPLGLMRFFDEKTRKAKFLAFVCTLLVFCGMLLTYSRGGFITLVLLVVLIMVLRYVKFTRVALAVGAMLLIIAVASPGYFLRMSSITNVQALFTKDASVKADGATRGRMTEMLAAFKCYLDHPIVGVGPGQYSKYYSVEYMADPSIAFREILSTRRAHTLYFELLAETGTFGFVTFMAIVLVLLTKLWRLRKWFEGRDTELANLATGFWLSIVAHLFTAMFLHFSYQRYYWLLLAVAGAAAHILEERRRQEMSPEETPVVAKPSPELEGAI